MHTCNTRLLNHIQPDATLQTLMGVCSDVGKKGCSMKLLCCSRLVYNIVTIWGEEHLCTAGLPKVRLRQALLQALEHAALACSSSVHRPVRSAGCLYSCVPV